MEYIKAVVYSRGNLSKRKVAHTRRFETEKLVPLISSMLIHDFGQDKPDTKGLAAEVFRMHAKLRHETRSIERRTRRHKRGYGGTYDRYRNFLKENGVELTEKSLAERGRLSPPELKFLTRRHRAKIACSLKPTTE